MITAPASFRSGFGGFSSGGFSGSEGFPGSCELFAFSALSRFVGLPVPSAPSGSNRFRESGEISGSSALSRSVRFAGFWLSESG